jgi:hypothetical protein
MIMNRQPVQRPEKREERGWNISSMLNRQGEIRYSD